MVNRERLIHTWQTGGRVDHLYPTFNAGDVDVELNKFLAGPLDTLINSLDDLFGVLLHPPGSKAGNDVKFAVLEIIQAHSMPGL